MKLYYYPGACSLAAHIVLRELNREFSLVKVDLASKRTELGEDFLSINPKGYVPALQLPDGGILTEDQVILQYLADSQAGSGLAPAAGTLERYRLLEWLAFIATELHKGFGPLWNPTIPDTIRQMAVERLAQRFAYVEERLGERPYLLGGQFSIADAYLYTVLNWTNFHRIDLSSWPRLVEFQRRVGARPTVMTALQAEGLSG